MSNQKKAQKPKDGKCIWITGATSGIGKAIAERYAEQGNLVIASGRNESALASMASNHKGKIVPLVVDLSEDQSSLMKVQESLAEKTDYLDMVICCAGVCEYEDDLKFDLDMYRRVFEVNFFGAVKTVKIGLPLLAKSEGRPQLVAVGSLSSIVGLPRAEAYGASKAALDYFWSALKSDLVKLPIDLTVVRPGFVKTALTEKNDFDMPFMVTAEEAAEVICHGLASRKKEIEFPRRLSWLIRSMARLKTIWYKFIAPSITRVNADHWPLKQK